MSVQERSVTNASSKQRNKLLFRPRRRLRHLRGVEAFRLGTDPDSLLHYELHLDTSSEIIRSERTRCSRHVEWEPLDFDSMNLPAPILHGYRSGVFRIVIYSSTRESSDEPVVILQAYVDLNKVISTRKPEDFEGVCFRLENGLHCIPSPDSTIPVQHTTVVKFANLDTEVSTMRSDSRSDGSDYSSSHPASSSNEGIDTWTENHQGAKLYNTMERRVDIRRLAMAHNNLLELIDRRQKLNLYLTKLLTKGRQRIEDIHKLKQLKQLANEKGVQAVNIEFKLSEKLEYWTVEREKKLKVIEYLEAALTELKDAVCHLMESSESLSQQIASKSENLHNQLVARRCNLVSSVAACFGLRPYSISPVSPGSRNVEVAIEKQWWPAKNPPLSPFLSHSESQSKISLDDQKGHAYLGIVGMDLSPGVVGMIENGLVERSLTQAQRECIEAALGYVASIVTLCSHYLDVPLRYPIRLLGSRSMITLPSSSKFFAPTPTTREGSAGQVAQQFPLFFQGSGGTSKRRVAHGFTLLDRNIQQLLATHGVKSNDRSCLLQNLDALVSASRSGVSSKRDPQ